MLERLLRTDRRWIFLILLVSLIVSESIRAKLSGWLPMGASSLVEGIWRPIEELPPRTPVLLSLDFDPAAAPELEPMTRSALRQAFRKNLRVITMTVWVTGVEMVRDLLAQTAAEFDDVEVEVVSGLHAGERAVVNVGHQRSGPAVPWRQELREALAGAKAGPEAVTVTGLANDGRQALRVVTRTATLEYGRDYSFLGTKAGEQIVVIAMGESIPTTFPTDPRTGKPTRDLPIMDGVRSLRDLGYILAIAAGRQADYWIIYGAQKHRLKMGVGCTAVMAPDLYPFYGAKQITGLAGGMKGAWEYESLVGTRGSATLAAPTQTVAHLVLMLLIIFCNVAWFLGRKGQGARP